MEQVFEYAPIIIVILMFFWNYRVFATPVDLEKKHRQILEDVSKIYETKDSVNDLRDKFKDMADKIDKIYDILMANK